MVRRKTDSLGHPSTSPPWVTRGVTLSPPKKHPCHLLLWPPPSLACVVAAARATTENKCMFEFSPFSLVSPLPPCGRSCGLQGAATVASIDLRLLDPNPDIRAPYLRPAGQTRPQIMGDRVAHFGDGRNAVFFQGGLALAASLFLCQPCRTMLPCPHATSREPRARAPSPGAASVLA